MGRVLWDRVSWLVDRGPRALLVGGVLVVASSGVPLLSGEDKSSLGGPATVRAGSPDDTPIVLAAVTNPALIEPSAPASAPLADRPLAEASPSPVVAPENPMSGAAPTLDTWQQAAAEPVPARPEPRALPETRSDWTAATIGDLTPDAPKPQIVPPLPPRALLKTTPAPAGLPATVLGTWVPNRDVCADPASSDYLPLVISRSAAKAGEGSCTFLSKKQVGRAFKVTADCTDGTSTWSANVTLSVVNRRLTWASERGIETYERCERAPVVASKAKAERVAAARKPARAARAEPKKATVKITSGSGPTQLVTVLRR
jgi:hypothetical protein